MPDWLKIGLVIIAWDIARLFLQAYVNKKILKPDFDEIDEALDDIEEDIEGNNGNTT